MSALTVSQVLDRAADLIEPEGAWTQGTLFRKANGKEARVSDKDKVCFCAAGALVETGGPWSAAWSFLEDTLPPTRNRALNPVAVFNDAPKRTQPEVVAALRKAAALAREQGK